MALFGGVKLNLGMAQPEAPESIITVVVIFGGAAIIAPPGVSIQLSGLSLFGGKSDKRRGGPALPGSPLVRVRAFVLSGGVAQGFGWFTEGRTCQTSCQSFCL